MRFLAVTALAAAVFPAAAFGQQATIVQREVPLGPTRSLASSRPAEPFHLVGLHWQGSGTVRFRTRTLGGRWSGWAEAEAENRPDAGTAEAGRRTGWRLGNPTWVGPSDRIEYRRQGRVLRLRAFFVRSPTAAVPLRTLQKADAPAVVTRAAWGANESIRRAAPRYSPGIRVAIVHHTAGSNAYTAAESASVVRAIQVYHVKGNGWNDIGYNFLVDKYGKVFEGRYGGIDRNVVGAHAEGFNTGSVGAAVLGEYSSLSVPTKAQEALAGLLAWRLDLAHVDPRSTLLFASGGNPRFTAGAPVFLRAVSGHRDTGFTDCPGRVLYGLLGEITGDAAELGLPKLYAPTVSGAVPGNVRFRARLSAPLDWLVEVKDSRGTSVATNTGYGQTVDWTWPAAGLPAGSYSYAIRATGVTPASGTIGGPAAPTGSLAVSGVGAEPATITPNDDGADDATAIAYTLSTPATVTATVRDALGAEVLRLSRAWRRAGSHTLRFDGSGLPDGVYSIDLTAQATGGRTATGSAQVTVTRTLGFLAADRRAFSPNGDGRADGINLFFRLQAPAEVRVRLLRDGKWVTTLAGGPFEAGPHRLPWTGAKRLGRARDGEYEAVVEATDVFTTTSLRVPFALDTTAPRIRIVQRAPLKVWVSEPVRLSLRAAGRSFKRDVEKAGEARVFAPRLGLIRIVAWDAAGNTSGPVSRR
jgi:N-acetylmuramoyl-L-alanine amidase